MSVHFSLQNKDLPFNEKISVWIHEHPTTIKILKIAALVLGLGILASLPFSAPVLGMGVVVCLAISGVLLTLASSVALFALDFWVPPHHDMKKHVYKPSECEGGKLYYEGDVPILSLDSDDPFKVGKAHGYLCGDAIDRLTTRFARGMHTFDSYPKAAELTNILEIVRQSIPAPYLLEINGLVEGYNQWAQEQSWWRFPKKLTVDEVMLFHLIPDFCHLALREEAALLEKQDAACSAIVDRDFQNRFVFARNMDWHSFGLAGTYSLIIHRKRTSHDTLEVGLPSFIGTLTGMNSQGLCLAMNTCYGHTRQIKGMPAAFYNRSCLEQCRTVDDALKFIHNQSPLGPYHLTVVDQNQAKSIHFYQSPENTQVIRSWGKGQPLSTLNYRYTPQPDIDMHYSAKRQRQIDTFFQQREKNRPFEEVLSLPFVNNWLTTHRVIMEPGRKVFRVAFDNAFAGKAALYDIPAQKLFSRGSEKE